MMGWLLLGTAVLLGAALGLGGYTFVYAKGYSYMLDDPAVCANCHIMRDHYDAWLKSSHHAVTGCNGCHTPHDSLLAKYTVKAKNGFWHSFYFTTGGFPDPIRITEPNHAVVENACRDCHQTITDTVDHGLPADAEGIERLDCTHCHRYVGHLVR
jgi:cytochrome c nitrite reductase small subunit